MPSDAHDDTLTPSQARHLTAASGSHPAHAGGVLPDRYELGAVLGLGGMGEVVSATDTQIGRDVAIKRMRVAPVPAARARFFREAKIQGQLDHPAIVPVHELGLDGDGEPFFVMKKLTGKTLAAHLAAGTKTRQQLLRALAEVCLAVDFAHSRGIVHRDLKPANIVLGDFGEVYVLDWGLASVAGEANAPLATGEIAAGGEDAAATAAIVTETGGVFGTPGYIAPELLAGGTIDARADVYAIGCILFEVLAGEPLLAPGDRASLDAAHAAAANPRPSQRTLDGDVPPELDELVVSATRPARDDRLASARDIANALERFLDGDRDAARRRQLATAHLAAARAALAAGDGERERAAAMRDAGRALALDPTSAAAEVIAALMLRLPTAVAPREVEQRLGEIEASTARDKTYSVTVVGLAYLAFVPLLCWIGVREASWIVAFTGLAIVDMLWLWLISRNRSRVSAGQVYAGIVLNALLTGVIARMFSPVMVAPGIAAVSLLVFGIDVRVRGWLVIATHIAGVAVPWLLEVVGVLSRTMAVVDGDFVIHSPALYGHAPAAEISLAIYAVALIGLAGYSARQVGHGTRAALRRSELQAWHLRQLAG